MAEQTDWYERGCSRSCRNKHTKVWGWCDLAEEPEPKLNLHAFEMFTASDGNTSMRYRQLTAEEARAELEKFEPAPGWADLRKAAKAAGWTPELWCPGQVHWGRRNPNRFIERQYGWATVRSARDRIIIDLHGPADHEDNAPSAHLVNPTPGRILAVARALGIGGDR